jgi:uncharacterized protein YkwD
MPTFVRTLLAALALTVFGAGPAHAADATDRAIVKAINVQRTHHGLHRVKLVKPLARTAGSWSAAMARSGTLAHGDFAARLRGAASRSPLGETIALAVGGEATLDRQVVQMWMHSPPHRAILLSSRVRHVGVGRARGSAGWYVTADFSG